MKLRNKTRGLLALAVAIPALLSVNTAQAHIVGIGWNVQPNGDVVFSALHWHGTSDQGSGSGALIVDGVSYAFTSATLDTDSMAVAGALVNVEYSAYDGTNLTAEGVEHDNSNDGGDVDDWLHVTVSGLTTGSHTLDAAFGPGGLTSWTLDGNIQTAGIVLPPPPPPTGGGVPDSGSTVALLGLSMLGLGLAKRKF